jgi:hypothetical protein
LYYKIVLQDSQIPGCPILDDDNRRERVENYIPLQSRPLFHLFAQLAPAVSLGETPSGTRKIVNVTGGTFKGDRLEGVVLPGGGDWALTRGDNVLLLDVRLTLQTNDGALIYCRYEGMRHGPAEVMARLASGEKVDPAQMYFRIQPRFETADSRYAWLNGILAVGMGERLPEGPRYHIHEIL